MSDSITTNGSIQNNGTTVKATVWYFNALRTPTTLTLTSTGGKNITLTLNLKTLESLWDTLTAQEQSTYSWVENDTPVNATVEIALSMAEMQHFKSIKEKVTPRTIEKSANVMLNGIKSMTNSSATASDVTHHEHRISHLQNVVTACDESYWMLQYDIPEVKNDDCPNPSALLWRYGFRSTKSVWILPERNLKAQEVVDLLALWTAHKIKVRVWKYDAEEVSKIKDAAREELEDEIRRAHTSLIESIGSADKQLKEALEIEGPMTPNSVDKAEEYRDNRVRATIRIAAEALDRAIACAQLFDQTENVNDLLEALRETVNSHKNSFNVKMYAKNRKPV